MRHWGKRAGGIGLLLWCALACSHELSLPLPEADAPHDSGESEDGTTGAGGAPTDAHPGKLPVIDRPFFNPTAGSGGEKASNGLKGAGGKHGFEPKVAGGAASSSNEAGQSGAAGAEPQLETPHLLFSEYVEGTGSFKALEIFALSGGSLEGCELRTYFNGKREPGRLALHGELEVGQVQVLCSSALATAQPALCDRATGLTFNGDDALELTCGGDTLDIIGQIGVDPGDSWGAGATLDHTLRRRCAVKTGRLDGEAPFAVDAEWDSFVADTFSNLGKHDCPP